jgi:hypothetical protein
MPRVDMPHTTHYASCGCAEAKIERLEEQLAQQVFNENEQIENLSQKLTAAAARSAELEALLQPFAYDDPQGDCFPDDDVVEIRCEGYQLLTATMGDLREAALKGGDDGEL